MEKILKLDKNKEFFTVREAADVLGVSRVTVFNRIKNGQIKAERFGRNYLIRKDVFNSFLLDADGLTGKIKKDIDEGVVLAIKDYGDVLKKLGRE
jgi:excisionase family DNA binding protein